MTGQLTNWENKLQMKTKTRRKGEEENRRKERGGREKEKERIKKVKRASRLGGAGLREVVVNERDKNRKVREE